MEKLRDNLGRFKSSGLPPKKRVRTEYNLYYQREVRSKRSNYKAYRHEQYLKRRENHLEHTRAYIKAHPEVKRAAQKKYRDANKEKIAQKNREWGLKNREKTRLGCHRRRIRKLEAQGSFTLSEWLSLKAMYDNRCLSCNKKEPEIKLTIDHVVPLFEGGTDDISNIQPLCGHCNRVKHLKVIDYRVKQLYGKPKV